MSDEREEATADEAPTFEKPTDLRFVGPATAEVLAESDISAAGIAEKRVTYRDLVDAGVNPGVAARIRREHSLAWSTAADGDDLERRSAQIRGLGDAERAWVAASSGDWTDTEAESDRAATDEGDASATAGDRRTLTTSDWTPTGDATQGGAETDGSGDLVEAEHAWRTRSKPTPVTDVEAIGASEADALADAGITSVRSLATADPEHVADALGLDEARVRDWHDAAKQLFD